jgi:hypothetical protein
MIHNKRLVISRIFNRKFSTPADIKANKKVFGAALFGLIGFIGFVIANYQQGKEIHTDIVDSLSCALRNTSIFPHTTIGQKTHTERKDLEARITLAEFGQTGHYTIIYGAKGVGKSKIVDEVAKGHKGVVKIALTTANSRSDIIKILSKKLLGNETTFDEESLISAINKSEITPTIIFDVERGGSPDLIIGLQAVRSFAKSFAPYCHCLIVLSEANAVLEFGYDPDRENFIFVDEMTFEEAKVLLTNLDFKISDEELRYIAETIRTRPAMLENLASKQGIMTVTQFVDDVLAQAHQDLAAFPYKPILKALKEHPEGVPPDYFENVEFKGVDMTNPKALGTSMKNSNAIIYRIERRLYILMSTAHRTGLRTYKFPCQQVPISTTV